MFAELQAFADSALNAALDSRDGYNISALGSPAIATLEPGSPPAASKWYNGSGTLANLVDLSFAQNASWVVGANQSGTPGYGDAVALVDLGSRHRISCVTLGFYYGQAWQNGGKIEISLDNNTFCTVTNKTSGTLGAGDYKTTALTEEQKRARYIRLTNYNSAFSQSVMLEMEAFASPVQEQGTMVLLR